MISLNTRGGTTHVTMPSVLDMAIAEELLATMHKAVYRGRPVDIDCSEVTTMSTSCAQILLAAEKELAQSDQAMILSQSSDEFDAAMTDLGLAHHLENWKSHQ